MVEYVKRYQRAGALVKTYTTDRKSFVLQGNRWVEKEAKHPAMWKRSWEKMELYLALFEFSGSHYILTFSDEHLPRDFAGVKRRWGAFLKRTKRKFPAFRKYVYSIEAGHTRGRWHIHFVADDRELPREAVPLLWHYGIVDPGWHAHPVVSRTGGYRYLAKYLTKDGCAVMKPVGAHEWGFAREMRRMLPPPRTVVTVRRPAIPRDVFWASRETKRTDDPRTGQSMGEFFCVSWIEDENKYTRAHARARGIYTTILD